MITQEDLKFSIFGSFIIWLVCILWIFFLDGCFWMKPEVYTAFYNQDQQAGKIIIKDNQTPQDGYDFSGSKKSRSKGKKGEGSPSPEPEISEPGIEPNDQGEIGPGDISEPGNPPDQSNAEIGGK